MEKSLSLLSRTTSVVYPTRILFVLAATAVPGLAPVAAGAQQSPATPTALLKWSMSKYAAMPTFQAECKWSQVYPGTQGSEAERTIQYARPNQFKMVTTNTAAHTTQTSVCDGKKMVEYMTSGNAPALSYAAPPSLTEARSMYLQHPMFCGTLLYRFFGGPDKYAALVDATKLAPKFAAPVTLDGQKCQTVTFWVTEMYGTTEVAIGAQDGLVHRIRYNSEPQMEQTKKMIQTPEFLAQMKKAGVNMNAKDLLKTCPRRRRPRKPIPKSASGSRLMRPCSPLRRQKASRNRRWAAERNRSRLWLWASPRPTSALHGWTASRRNWRIFGARWC